MTNSEAAVDLTLQNSRRSATLRVYNYYRIVLSLLFLLLFSDIYSGDFVGSVNPELFHRTILVYLAANILIGLSASLANKDILSKTGPSLVILLADIVGLTLLMHASGGVSSGLGNFLIFTVAFGGGLIFGRISTLLPAFAVIITLYSEFLLYVLGQSEFKNFFQVGVLGIVYFVANLFFQSLARQLLKRESEVLTLEQINQLIVRQMRTGVVITSEAGDIKMMNSAGERLLYPAGNSANKTQLPLELKDRILAEETDSSLQTTQLYSSEAQVSINYSSVAMPTKDTLIFIEDSTEVQRRAQQLKLASLGRLSASIAHEIRNPLGVISHAAQLLDESPSLSQEDRHLSELIQTHCLRMNNVIENVLQISRRRDASPQKLELRPALDLFRLNFEASQPHQINIEIRPDENSEGLSIQFDPHHLPQVLGNLCQNGLRYSEKQIGEAKLILRYGSDNTKSYIEVIDFGPGITPEQVPNLFEPFYTTEASGTGLGLYLARELCESNNAQLSYTRAKTGGSSFRISFQPSPG